MRENNVGRKRSAESIRNINFANKGKSEILFIDSVGNIKYRFSKLKDASEYFGFCISTIANAIKYDRKIDGCSVVRMNYES